MTYEEALKWTNDSISRGRIYPEQENYSYMYRVQGALAKQIPKKPLNIEWKDKEEKYISRWTCPHCMFNYSSTIYSHCWRCGQRINWVEILS